MERAMEEAAHALENLAVEEKEKNFENALCWWWGYSRRDVWMAECKLDYVTPQNAWSAACFPSNDRAVEWLTRMRIPWTYNQGYISVRDPIGPWLRLRMLHYGAPPTSYEPLICDGVFAKIGAIKPMRRDRAEYGRDTLHRSMIKISGACVLWDLPALISFESVHYGDHAHVYIFTLHSFITLRVRLTSSDCLHVEQEVVN